MLSGDVASPFPEEWKGGTEGRLLLCLWVLLSATGSVGAGSVMYFTWAHTVAGGTGAFRHLFNI